MSYLQPDTWAGRYKGQGVGTFKLRGKSREKGRSVHACRIPAKPDELLSHAVCESRLARLRYWRG